MNICCTFKYIGEHIDSVTTAKFGNDPLELLLLFSCSLFFLFLWIAIAHTVSSALQSSKNISYIYTQYIYIYIYIYIYMCKYIYTRIYILCSSLFISGVIWHVPQQFDLELHSLRICSAEYNTLRIVTAILVNWHAYTI